nr:ABC transporter ATP-binding protein [uncultured Methanospirillum sp.]
MKQKKPVLQISNLSVTFRNKSEAICALAQFSCSMFAGECTAVIGESGCGKSVAAHAILQLFHESTELSGSIKFDDLELLTLPEHHLQEIRGKRIGIVYQNPDRSLNPIYKIGRQMKEPLDFHHICNSNNRWDHIRRTLKRVGFSDPDHAMMQYPCHNSGGMNQRAATAVILGLKPDIVIADEPTKGLDRDRLADIESCLQEIKNEGQSLLLITHDIPMAERVADELIVMYAGQIVEKGPVKEVLYSPLHPYTAGLIKSLPQNGFIPIDGNTPPLSSLPSGCRFAQRCKHASDLCHNLCPVLTLKNGREVRCHQY